MTNVHWQLKEDKFLLRSGHRLLITQKLSSNLVNEGTGRKSMQREPHVSKQRGTKGYRNPKSCR